MGRQRVRHIFISYSRDDKAWAYEFANALTDKLGFSVFVDYKGIHIGVNWWRTICEHIETCDYVLFIMSPMAIDSIYCSAEIDYALALNKPILPIMLKPCSFPTKLSQNQVQYLALNDNMQIEQILIELQKGLSDIRDLIYEGEYKSPNPPPNRPNEPKPVDKKSAEEVFHIAIDMMNHADFDQAVLLFHDVITADKTGKWGKLAQKRLNEVQSYQEVARLLPKSPRDARDLWAEHCDEFDVTEFDPLGLAEKLAKSKPQTPPTNTPVGTGYIPPTPDTAPKPKPIIETPQPPKIIAPTRKSLALMPKPFAWVDIPAGQVTLTDIGGYLKEPTTFAVDAFQMAKYPVTNAQFDVFINHPDGYKNPAWWDFSQDAKKWRAGRPQMDKSGFDGGDCPREMVSWYDSVAFCLWLSAMTDEKIMLPTEQQWQRAAQGDTKNEYPWGDKIDKTFLNYNQNIGRTTPVTQYPKGASPYGVMDMAGNGVLRIGRQARVT